MSKLEKQFTPEHKPEDPFLPAGIVNTGAAADPASDPIVGDTISGPAGIDEARATYAKSQDLLARSTRLRAGITALRNHIDSELTSGDVSRAVTVDVSNKSMLRNAIQKVFGVKSDVITYEMYRRALEAKQVLEYTEANKYVNEA